MEYAYLAQFPPPLSVGCEHDITETIGEFVEGREQGPATALKVVDFQELSRHVGRRSDDRRDGAELEVDEGAMCLGEFVQGAMRELKESVEVSNEGKVRGARWELPLLGIS